MSVIVAYVPTPEGRAALDFAVKAAADRGDSLRIADGSGGRRDLAGDADHVPFERVGELVPESGPEYQVLAPATAGMNLDETTAAAVQDPEADIIVIGVRHRTAMGKFLLGSSAQKLILDAECPVVVVKAPRAKQ